MQPPSPVTEHSKSSTHSFNSVVAKLGSKCEPTNQPTTEFGVNGAPRYDRYLDWQLKPSKSDMHVLSGSVLTTLVIRLEEVFRHNRVGVWEVVRVQCGASRYQDTSATPARTQPSYKSTHRL
jgi:hypothetical protein